MLFLWVWNLVSHTKGRIQIEGVWEQGVRRISEPEREEVVGEWRRLHNEELHNLYASQNMMKVRVKQR